MSQEKQTYSPLPPEDYSYSAPCNQRAGIGYEMSTPEERAAWNLYWMSDPAIDDLALLEPKGAQLDYKMLARCYEALDQELGGFKVRELLETLTPTAFVERVKANDHKHLAPYAFAGEAWLRTIGERARAPRGLIEQVGKVFYAQFRRR